MESRNFIQPNKRTDLFTLAMDSEAQLIHCCVGQRYRTTQIIRQTESDRNVSVMVLQ